MFCFPCQKLLHSFCCKALLLFEQRWKIWQGGCSDVIMCFLPPLRKFAQIYSLTCISLETCLRFTTKIPEDFLALRRTDVSRSVGGAVLANQDLAAPVHAEWMGYPMADLRAVSPVLSMPTGRTLRKWEGACVRCGSAQSGMNGEAARDERMNIVPPACASQVVTSLLFGQMSSRSLIISIPGVNRNPCEGQLEVTGRPGSFPPLGRWDWDGQGQRAEREKVAPGSTLLLSLLCATGRSPAYTHPSKRLVRKMER